MSTERRTKDPDSVLDFLRDWSQWLIGSDVIVASTWTITPSGSLTVDSDTFSDTTATVWLSGGKAGETYHVTNRITTDDGRTDDRTFVLGIEQR